MNLLLLLALAVPLSCMAFLSLFALLGVATLGAFIHMLGAIKAHWPEVIGTAGQLAEKNKNRLVVEAQESLGALTADAMRLKQILLNLLSNARKFTKEGEVALRLRKVADGRDWVEFAVSDTGIGMTSEQ